MKLLFLTSYFYPEQAASSYLGDNIRAAICDAGIEIELYTPVPSRGISLELREEYIKKKHERLWDNKMRVHRFSLMKEGRNPIQRASRYFLCCLKQFFLGVFSKDAKMCDVLFVASTPPIQGTMAALIKKIRNIPFVYNLQDIFPDSLAGTNLAKRGGMWWKIGRVIEDFTYKHADKIIVISEDFKRNIIAKGVPEEKIIVVYNWVDQNAVVNIPREENKLIVKYGLSTSKFYITYSGNIGLTQNMDMLLDIAKSLTSIKDIHFVLIGEGAYKATVEKRIVEEKIENITMLPFQPYKDISHVFSLGDVGLVISKPGVGSNSVPSKTWSIMSASRPVLASFDENELKDILEGAISSSGLKSSNGPCGIFVKAGDVNGFIAAIINLYHNRELCKELGKNGRQFVINNLTKEVGTQKYVNVIKSVVNKSNN